MADEKVKKELNSPEEPEVNTEGSPEVVNLSYKDKIKAYIADGAVKLTKLHIRSVEVTPRDTHTMVSVSLKEKIPAFVSNDNGQTYEKSVSNLFFTSDIAIIGCIRENDEYSFLANKLRKSPKSIIPLITGATIDVLQWNISEGNDIIRPFSENTEDLSTANHDIIITNIINIEFGKTGARAANIILDKMLDDDINVE